MNVFHHKSQVLAGNKQNITIIVDTGGTSGCIVIAQLSDGVLSGIPETSQPVEGDDGENYEADDRCEGENFLHWTLDPYRLKYLSGLP